ncbi:MAG: hypothetical protein KBA51_06175 [Kiritimatiellae bacterium]|nr:hypothetical protein [Kiritimatiellia bacterium]
MFIFAFGIVFLFGMLIFGWIVPLTTGLALRRDPPRRARPWLMTAAIWGGVSALLVTGFIVFVVLSIGRSMIPDRLDAEHFDTRAYTGATTSLPVPEGMTVRLVAGTESEESPTWVFESEPGVLTVPEGKLILHEVSLKRTDEDGVVWHLESGWYGTMELDPRRDPLPWADVFRVGMEVTMSPFSDEIQAELQFADVSGRLYDLKSPCGSPDTAQGLELIDGRGETVWTGRFSFG